MLFFLLQHFLTRPSIQQALDGYFNSVCELDLVFSLHKSLMSEFFGRTNDKWNIISFILFTDPFVFESS